MTKFFATKLSWFARAHCFTIGNSCTYTRSRTRSWKVSIIYLDPTSIQGRLVLFSRLFPEWIESHLYRDYRGNCVNQEPMRQQIKTCEFTRQSSENIGLPFFSDDVLTRFHIEQFSIECQKTKTKVITTTNQNKDKYHNEPMRAQSKHM